MKILTMIFSITMLLSLSSCGNTNINNSHDSNGSTSAITSTEPKKADAIVKSRSSYAYVANERDPYIRLDLVGDPMEAYFVSDTYKTKSDTESNNPIYSNDSFIKGTYPG